MTPGRGWVDTSLTGPPASEVHIDHEVARAVVREAAPEFADQELGERFDGWDMAVFRLGSSLALRLPRTGPAVTSLDVEVRALTELGSAWTFPHPRVVRRGEPTARFPWPWAITTWLDGQTADTRPLAASAGADVGAALAQVHVRAPADAPLNLEQSVTLAEREAGLEASLARLGTARGPHGESLDMAAARAVWSQARAVPEPDHAGWVWSHADGHGSNLLGRAGAFAGIIDWGKMAPCDRAVDLAFLYTAMPLTGVEAAIESYRAATGVIDPGLADRARGIALAKAAAWATLTREVNVLMAWRSFAAVGVVAAAE